MEKKDLEVLVKLVKKEKSLIAKMETKNLLKIEKLEQDKNKFYTEENLLNIENQINKLKQEIEESKNYYLYLSTFYWFLLGKKNEKIGISKLKKYHIECIKRIILGSYYYDYINRNSDKNYLEYYYNTMTCFYKESIKEEEEFLLSQKGEIEKIILLNTVSNSFKEEYIQSTNILIKSRENIISEYKKSLNFLKEETENKISIMDLCFERLMNKLKLNNKKEEE